jgi:hypothetical protein
MSTIMTITIVNWHYIWGAGVGHNLYTFHWFWLLAALSNDLATFIAKDCQHPGMASAYSQFIRMVKQCSEQSGWLLELPDIETSILFHFSFFQAAATYTPALLASKSLLLHSKVFINALSISYRSFLAESQERWSETAWKVQIISVRWGGGFLPTVVCRNSDNQQIFIHFVRLFMRNIQTAVSPHPLKIDTCLYELIYSE